MHKAPGFLHPLRFFGTLRPINVSWTRKFFFTSPLRNTASNQCILNKKVFFNNVSPPRNTASNQCILKHESFFVHCFASSEYCVQSMYPEQEKVVCWQCFASSEHCVQSMYPKKRKLFFDNVSPPRNTVSNQCILNKKFFCKQCFASSEHCVQSMYPETRKYFVDNVSPLWNTASTQCILTMFHLLGTLRPLNVSWTRKIFVVNVLPLRNTASAQCILNKKDFCCQCFASSEQFVNLMYPEQKKFFFDNHNFLMEMGGGSVGSSLGSNPKISQKYKMVYISKGVGNTFQIAKKIQKKQKTFIFH
jgi:hypothetical protein